MGIGQIRLSKCFEYSTPLSIVNLLTEEFAIKRDVCVSYLNFKLPLYWTKEDDAKKGIFSIIDYR